MKVEMTTEAIRRAKLQSNHHHQQINIRLFTDRMPFLLPKPQCHSTDPRLTGGLSTLTWTIKASGYLGASFKTKWKKNAQRRCKHCVLAVVRQWQKFSPRRRPPSRGRGTARWRWSLPLPTNPVWWGSMHAISSNRGNRPSHTHSHPPTDRTDYNTLHR